MYRLLLKLVAQGKFSFQQYNALLNSVQLEDFKGVDRPLLSL
jgi:hypothetical protein